MKQGEKEVIVESSTKLDTKRKCNERKNESILKGYVSFDFVPSSLLRHYNQGMVVHADFGVSVIRLRLLFHHVVVALPPDLGVPKLEPCRC